MNAANCHRRLSAPRAAANKVQSFQAAMPIHLSTAQPDFEIRFAGMLAMKREDATDVNDAVAAIIADVRTGAMRRWST